MGIGDHLDTVEGWHAAAQALIWQAELGAVDPCLDAPVNRYDLPDQLPGARPLRAATVAQQTPAADPAVQLLPVQAIENMATLAELHAALAAFDQCELKRGARTCVFADGNPQARVMIIGEAPGRDEDIEGRPFVGRAGQLLDRMFAAIGLSRTQADPGQALYITNVLPWRPPQNRDPSPDEVAMLLPFLARHVALANPEVIVVMGNIPLFAASGSKGILKRRGNWEQGFGKPMLPMAHPAYLLRNPAAKREAWADLLTLQARLSGAA